MPFFVLPVLPHKEKREFSIDAGINLTGSNVGLICFTAAQSNVPVGKTSTNCLVLLAWAHAQPLHVQAVDTPIEISRWTQMLGTHIVHRTQLRISDGSDLPEQPYSMCGILGMCMPYCMQSFCQQSRTISTFIFFTGFYQVR